MKNFLREYEITIQKQGKTLHKFSTLRIKFQIEKFAAAIDNRGSISIYNLDETIRKELARTRLSVSEGPYATLFLRVGYSGDDKQLLFRGSVIRAANTRIGPDTVTEIEAWTATGQLGSALVPPGTSFRLQPLRSVIDALFAPLQWGAVQYSPEAAVILDANTKVTGSYSGRCNTELGRVLSTYGLEFTIDDGGPKVVKKSGAFNSHADRSEVPRIAPGLGMVGTPILNEAGAKVVSILRPDIIPFKRFRVVSETLENSSIGGGKPTLSDHEFTARTVKHTGDSHGETWFTEVEGIFYPEIGMGNPREKAGAPEAFLGTSK